MPAARAAVCPAPRITGARPRLSFSHHPVESSPDTDMRKRRPWGGRLRVQVEADKRCSSRDRTRTCDPLINSQLLYQLSYSGRGASAATADRTGPPARLRRFGLSAGGESRLIPACGQPGDPLLPQAIPVSPSPMGPVLPFTDGPRRCAGSPMKFSYNDTIKPSSHYRRRTTTPEVSETPSRPATSAQTIKITPGASTCF